MKDTGYLTGLAAGMVPASPFRVGMTRRYVEMGWPMADNECPHGSLATDEQMGCTCWGPRA